jgi:hypothetical protein
MDLVSVNGTTKCSLSVWFLPQMERVNLNAVNSSGAYYKLSAFLDMSSDRTKVG